MTESEFTQQVDDIIMQIEDALDELDVDIDYESAAGILTIFVEHKDQANKTQLIISRQIAAMQLWLAAKSGGFHFNYDEQKGWIDERSGETFQDALNRCLTEQTGEPVDIELD